MKNAEPIYFRQRSLQKKTEDNLVNFIRKILDYPLFYY